MAPWPIVLFHTGDYNDISIQAELKKQLFSYIADQNGDDKGTGGPEEWHFVDRLEFIELKWSLPHGVSSDVQEMNPVSKQFWPGTYRVISFYHHLNLHSQHTMR